MKPVKNNKASKVKSFFFFLLIAILFWGLTKLSRQYTASVDSSILYTNIPPQMMLDDGNAESISFDITANGFEFLTYKLKVPILNIDVESFYEEETNKVVISKANVIQLVSKQLEKGVAIKNVSVNELIVKLNPIVSKKIPVLSQIKISYKNGFNGLDSLTVRPDSVFISGPEHALEEIDHIQTTPIDIKNAERDIEVAAALMLPTNGKISVMPDTVTLEMKVTEFSQMQMTVPLEIINLPSDTTLKLIPENVQITFSISVNDFKEISATDFTIICDYSKRNSDENYFIPILLKGPKNTRNIEILDKKIDFLIFK